MDRRGGRGRGGRRGRGGHRGRQEDHRPRKPSRTHYFETDASFKSAVNLTPVREDLKWKFARAGFVHYTRYELSLDEPIQRNGPQHDSNLHDIQRILDQMLHEAFHHAPSFQLSCQARVGKAVWLGDLIEHSKTHGMNLQLDHCKGSPRFVNGRPQLKNAFYTRASVNEDGIMKMLERHHEAHDEAHNSLQITVSNQNPGGEAYNVTLSKDPGTEHFTIEEVFRGDCFVQKASCDLVCLERFHDLRINTMCFEPENLQVEQLPDAHHFTTMMRSISLSEDGKLQMIIQSGPFQVEQIRKRMRVQVFHVAREKDWSIRYTRLSEYSFPVNYPYDTDVVVPLGNGNDNKELEVSLDRNIDRSADIRGLVEEIRRLIEFSLELVKLSDSHLDP